MSDAGDAVPPDHSGNETPGPGSSDNVPEPLESDPFVDLLREDLAPGLELIRLLGSGSVATVYLARETDLKRLVAVKALKPRVAAGDPIARRRFEREAQSAAQISHRNVTSVFRVGRLRNDVPYLVMEYVDGRNLAARLKAEGPLPVDEARSILREVASALAAAHEKGIIHRDVKPGNIMQERKTGRAVLTDFGIAAILATGSDSATRLTKAGQRVGDLRYMSPEQLKGEQVTEQADVYSLGILGYELLTGEGPYRATSITELATAHLRQPPVKLQALRPEVGTDLADLLERCLAKTPEHRPTANQVSRELAGVPPDRGSEPVPIESSLGRFFQEMRRRRVYQVAVAYLGASFVVLQGLEVVEPGLPLPHWVYPLIVTVALGGFPVALVLAWVFDITSSGIQRTRASGAPERGRGRAMQLLLQVVGLSLSLVLAVLIGYWILGS